MRAGTRKASPNELREANSNNTSLDKFTLANLPKTEIELKLSSNIALKSPPPEILKQAVADNTFENPIFKSNEQNRRSNWQVDPKITTYSYEKETLILPRGYLRNLLNIFKENDITPKIVDERFTNTCEFPDELKGITLRPYQQRAVDEALNYDQGVILAPTGSGKTIIGLEIIRRHGQTAIICVHRTDLARQWETLIKERLGIVPGFIGDGRWEVGNVTIAMIQSLTSQESQTKQLSKMFGLVLLDEHHHCPAVSTFQVLGLFQLNIAMAFLRAGTAGMASNLSLIVPSVGKSHPYRKWKLKPSVLSFQQQSFAIETGFNPGQLDSWHEYQAAIACDSGRNLMIIDLAKRSAGAVLILVDRVNHAEQLSEMLTRRNIDHTLAHGKIAKKDRGAIVEKIKSSKITVGTTSLLGEGLDIAIWGTLIMGAPISSEIKLTQAIGRIVRPADGKNVATVFDLKDEHAFSGASFNKRFEIYKKNRIWVEFR